MDIEQLLAQRARLVDSEMPNLLSEIKPPELAAAVTYAILSKGKRIDRLL
jgi:geranylgeranyl pyrophosphate synthase